MDEDVAHGDIGGFCAVRVGDADYGDWRRAGLDCWRRMYGVSTEAAGEVVEPGGQRLCHTLLSWVSNERPAYRVDRHDSFL